MTSSSTKSLISLKSQRNSVYLIKSCIVNNSYENAFNHKETLTLIEKYLTKKKIINYNIYYLANAYNGIFDVALFKT